MNILVLLNKSKSREKLLRKSEERSDYSETPNPEVSSAFYGMDLSVASQV